jgi:hypothetical protein
MRFHAGAWEREKKIGQWLDVHYSAVNLLLKKQKTHDFETCPLLFLTVVLGHAIVMCFFEMNHKFQ